LWVFGCRLRPAKEKDFTAEYAENAEENRTLQNTFEITFKMMPLCDLCVLRGDFSFAAFVVKPCAVGFFPAIPRPAG
jgi:hypothetical protein